MTNLLLTNLFTGMFAQEQAPGGGGGDLFGSMLPMLAMLAVLYVFIIVLPGNREKKKREELLGSMKKNDKVITTGGMVGHVANVSADSNEVTLKFGDNTRITFLKSAIQTVLREEKPEAEKANS
ncbi:preprotein translocase subunit YajC [Calycomorphotria hydatis]|uniref:Sec translocon accessory complex subunit YajC n=1 Tax=Calycomorphotria hydatis TaxID=2528027 RepID=A0A517T795_9PLAN|nr:preprotein translocase subunit YajC [Calycomorphotria hydatis]QDT64243.1 preprotein translocase subunit YajC [Calycomorphotria hydatis]